MVLISWVFESLGSSAVTFKLLQKSTWIKTLFIVEARCVYVLSCEENGMLRLAEYI